MTRRAFLQGLTGFAVATENAVALPSPVLPSISALLAQPWFLIYRGVFVPYHLNSQSEKVTWRGFNGSAHSGNL